MLYENPWRVERNTEAAIGEQRRAGIRDSLRYHSGAASGNSGAACRIGVRMGSGARDDSRCRRVHARGPRADGAGRSPLCRGAGDGRGISVEHAIQGRSPPVTLLRRLGFRTSGEICEERCGLKMLQGEYRSIGDPAGDPAPAQWSVMAAAVHEGVEA